MVDALHAAGIEVILDVVYNHTCEGGVDGHRRCRSRGLDAPAYYAAARRHDVDITGTGNTLDAGTPPVVRMVCDSMRYWATAIRRRRLPLRPRLACSAGPLGGPFDPHGSALLTAITTDPVLPPCKLIAEPWDATGEGYRGRRVRPVQWSEWNDRFRDTVRDFWRGHGAIGELGLAAHRQS